MKAVAYQTAGPIDRKDALVDITLDAPVPGPRDLLVSVSAVSVNPVDTKIRTGVSAAPGGWKVLGWDAAGTVVATGADVQRFKTGDAVFYAGDLTRPGTNSEMHVVDERIVGHAPKSIAAADAAALPLTAITAWEMLFDRLDVRRPVSGAAPAILIVGGAGGVGSIAIQLARRLTGLTVIATASRPETRGFALDLGAHHVIDHSQPLSGEVEALGIGAPAFVFSTTQTTRHLAEIAALIAPQGRFGLIDDPETLDINGFKRKAVSVHWEMMFTRSMFATADMEEQGKLLDSIAELVDDGRIRTTMTECLSPISAATLTDIHRRVESGTVRGKIVLQGF